MRKTLLAAAVAAATSSLFAAAPAMADDAPAAAPASPHTFTANVGVFSDYRFRGISQTFGKPAIQGGFDYSHASGVYLGNWNSNVSETAGYPNGNLESDFYGGWKTTSGDWGLDLGVLHYYYAGSDAAGNGRYVVANPHNTSTASGAVKNTELYVAGSWKFVTLKYSHAVSDYFSVPDTKGSHYIDLSAAYDLGGGWGLNGHVGHTTVKNFGEASYTDYRLGVTKDIGGFVFGATYVATNAKDDCSASGLQPYCFAKFDAAGNPTDTLRAGKSILVVSVSRTF